MDNNEPGGSCAKAEMVRNVLLIEIGMEPNMDNNAMSILWRSLMGSTTKRGF